MILDIRLVLPVCVCALSHVQLFWDPMDCSPPGSSIHGIFPGKNTGVGCHFLLQGIFPTGIEPVSLASHALAGRLLTTGPLNTPSHLYFLGESGHPRRRSVPCMLLSGHCCCLQTYPLGTCLRLMRTSAPASGQDKLTLHHWSMANTALISWHFDPMVIESLTKI